MYLATHTDNDDVKQMASFEYFICLCLQSTPKILDPKYYPIEA
jgi:hypothetical protein